MRLSDLFAQNNEHRMFFPKGFEILLGSITKYDNVAEMYVVLACFFVTLVGLLLAFRSNVVGGGFGSRLFLFVPVSLLVFGLRQHENMLFGYQINFAFTQTFGVLALFLLYVSGRDGSKKLAFAAALGSATVASFSTAQGLLAWPVGLLQLLVSPIEKPAKKVLVGVWGLVGLGEWAVYFFDYQKPKHHPSLLYVLDHPAVGTEYFLNSLGGALFWQQGSAFAGGLLVACLAVVSLLLVYKDGKLGECSFWVSLLLYSSLVLASITLGRSGFGAEQALNSRYATFSVLAVVGVYAMLAKLAFEKRSSVRMVSLVVLSACVLLSAAVSYPEGIEVGAEQKASREKAAFVLSTHETQPDQLLEQNLYPRAARVRRFAPILERLGYNVFSEPRAWDPLPPLSDLAPVASPTPSEAGAITGVIGLITRERSSVVLEGMSFITVRGWAVDVDDRDTAGGVYVDRDGKLFPAFYGDKRKKVARRLGVTAYEHSGFERAIPVSEIGAGTHELSIVVLTNDRKGYYRPNEKIAFETTRPAPPVRPSGNQEKG